MEIIDELFFWLSAWLMVLPRALGFFLILPFMGETFLPGFTRTAVIISMTVILVPVMGEQVNDIPHDVGVILFLILKEIFLGLLLGLMISLPFYAMDGVGALLDRQRGVMAGELFSPTVSSQSTILGGALSLFAIALLFASGGIYYLLDVFILGFEVWPVVTFFPEMSPRMGVFFLRVLDDLMYMVLLISAPVLIVIFLVDVGFGFLNRAVPQINVFFLSLPVKGGVSLLILAFYLTQISSYLRSVFEKFEFSLRALEVLFK